MPADSARPYILDCRPAHGHDADLLVVRFAMGATADRAARASNSLGIADVANDSAAGWIGHNSRARSTPAGPSTAMPRRGNDSYLWIVGHRREASYFLGPVFKAPSCETNGRLGRRQGAVLSLQGSATHDPVISSHALSIIGRRWFDDGGVDLAWPA